MADVKEAELQTINTIKDCFAFLKFSEDLSKAVKAILAIEDDMHPRDIGVLDFADYKSVITCMSAQDHKPVLPST